MSSSPPSSTPRPAAVPSTGMFPASLIDGRVLRAASADGFTVRPLAPDDYDRGFLDCLRTLTHVGDVTPAALAAIYDSMAAARGTYYFVVIEDADSRRVVGTGALVVEQKFIHDGGKCGHIEEIAIVKEYQGRGLGQTMMRALDSIAVNVGCYKNILNCGARNEAFYVKCGYKNSGIEMSHYFEEAKDDYHRG